MEAFQRTRLLSKLQDVPRGEGQMFGHSRPNLYIERFNIERIRIIVCETTFLFQTNNAHKGHSYFPGNLSQGVHNSPSGWAAAVGYIDERRIVALGPNDYHNG